MEIMVRIPVFLASGTLDIGQPLLDNGEWRCKRFDLGVSGWFRARFFQGVALQGRGCFVDEFLSFCRLFPMLFPSYNINASILLRNAPDHFQFNNQGCLRYCLRQLLCPQSYTADWFYIARCVLDLGFRILSLFNYFSYSCLNVFRKSIFDRTAACSGWFGSE